MRNVEPGLIFSTSGDCRRLRRISPLLFPQYPALNKYFLQKERDLPTFGLVTRFQVFDFGYSSGGGNQVAPFDTAYSDLQIGRDFLAEIITGIYGAVAAAVPPSLSTSSGYGLGGQINANQTPGFLVTFLHTHDGVQRQWENKPITDIEAVGNGTDPSLLKEPILLVTGDTLTCQLQNLSNVTLQAQILLIGGEFGDPPKTTGGQSS
jgi:hypothetical protein